MTSRNYIIKEGLSIMFMSLLCLRSDMLVFLLVVYLRGWSLFVVRLMNGLLVDDL